MFSCKLKKAPAFSKKAGAEMISVLTFYTKRDAIFKKAGTEMISVGTFVIKASAVMKKAALFI